MQIILTSLQSFRAMQQFLRNYYRLTSADDVGSLLSGIQFLQDGKTYDPVFWEDWLIIIGDKNNLTALEAFQTMQKFLKNFAELTRSDDLKTLLNYMQLSPENKTHDPAMWDKWIACVDGILKDDETLKALNKRITLNKSSSCYD